ncbi:hypothetical protein H0H87_009956, partial [Tephrocybe sp. NHM501043]
MHAPPQWAPHSQAAPQPMYPPSTSQQSQMPSQQPILQAPHPQATRRTLAPMPPGFVESTSNLAINVTSERLDATGITTIGASLDTLQEHRRRNNRSKLPCPEDLLALSALRQSNNPALPSPPMSSQGGRSVQASGGGGGTGLSKEERALAFVANRWLQKKVITRNPWAKTLTAGDYRNEAIEIANEARLSRE